MSLRNRGFLIFSFCFILLGFTNSRDNKLFTIPTRTIHPYKLMGETEKHDTLDVDGFEISSFITYREYKVYLQEVKKDSVDSFYVSQLPDSAMCLPDIYKKYVNSTEYDDYPVMGVSWDAAMNYCRWMTLKENKDSIRYIYRLPECSEWLDAENYLTSKAIANDFNRNYSDWLINSKDESAYDFSEDEPQRFVFKYEWTYWQEKSEPRVLKRKFVIGNSYLRSFYAFKDSYRLSYYSFNGYRNVGFRYVKCGFVNNSRERKVLKYWGINKDLKK